MFSVIVLLPRGDVSSEMLPGDPIEYSSQVARIACLLLALLPLPPLRVFSPPKGLLALESHGCLQGTRYSALPAPPPGLARLQVQRTIVVIVIIHALGKHEIPVSAEAVAGGLLEQDPERQQGRLVHAPLVRPCDASSSRRPIVALSQGLVEVAGVSVHGLQHVAVGQGETAAVREVLVGKVDVLLGVSLGCVLAGEEHLLGGEDGVGELVVAGGGPATAAGSSVFGKLEGDATCRCRDGELGGAAGRGSDEKHVPATASYTVACLCLAAS